MIRVASMLGPRFVPPWMLAIMLCVQAACSSNPVQPETDAADHGYRLKVSVRGSKADFDRFELRGQHLDFDRTTFEGRSYIQHFVGAVPWPPEERPQYELEAWTADGLAGATIVRPFVCDGSAEADSMTPLLEQHDVVLTSEGKFRQGVDPRWGILSYRCLSGTAQSGTGVATQIPAAPCGEDGDHSRINATLDGTPVELERCFSMLVKTWTRGFVLQLETKASGNAPQLTFQSGLCLDEKELSLPLDIPLHNDDECELFRGVSVAATDEQPWQEIRFTAGSWQITELQLDGNTNHESAFSASTQLSDGRLIEIQATIDTPVFRSENWDWE